MSSHLGRIDHSSSMKSFVFLILTTAALVGVTADIPKDLMVQKTGSKVKIPCDLEGPLLTWYWTPQYPVCADVKGDEAEVKIFSGDYVLNRFKQRSSKEGGRENGISSNILIIEALNMNDSGTFFCSSGNRKSSSVSITVKPGDQNDITVQPSEGSPLDGQSVTLSCKSCKNLHSDAKETRNSNITWTLNGKSFPNREGTLETRNSIRIKKFSRIYYGLWKCHRPACPQQSEGYCLENKPRKDRNKGELSTPAPTASVDARNTDDPVLIGACVGGLLAFLLVGAVILLICRRRRPRSTREPGMQGRKHSTVPEVSQKRRDQEDPGPKDHIPTEGAESVQYSTVEFRKTGRHQIEVDNGASAVIYAEMATGNSSR